MKAYERVFVNKATSPDLSKVRARCERGTSTSPISDLATSTLDGLQNLRETPRPQVALDGIGLIVTVVVLRATAMSHHHLAEGVPALTRHSAARGSVAKRPVRADTTAATISAQSAVVIVEPKLLSFGGKALAEGVFLEIHLADAFN
jgi:hypothetical protein